MLSSWAQPPANLSLASKDVHVWYVSLTQSSGRYLHLLTADERERAQRFRFDRDRDRFVVARGVLRSLLSRYLDIPPHQIRLGYTKFGKPYLQDQALHFNVSHSHDVALLAFCRDSEVGIDVEGKRPLSDLRALAEQVFSLYELEVLAALPREKQETAFFTAWARKEAFIKAVGEGFSYPLKEFDVTLAPGDPPQILRIKGSEREAAAWLLVELPSVPNFSNALVLRQHAWQISCWAYR